MLLLFVLLSVIVIKVILLCFKLCIKHVIWLLVWSYIQISDWSGWLLFKKQQILPDHWMLKWFTELRGWLHMYYANFFFNYQEKCLIYLKYWNSYFERNVVLWTRPHPNYTIIWPTFTLITIHNPPPLFATIYLYLILND